MFTFSYLFGFLFTYFLCFLFIYCFRLFFDFTVSESRILTEILLHLILLLKFLCLIWLRAFNQTAWGASDTLTATVLLPLYR